MDENRLRSLRALFQRGSSSLARRGILATLALGIALAPLSTASATVLQPVRGDDVYALTGDNELVRFSERAPLILRLKRKISGTDGTLIGIDFRPANQK